MAERNFKNLLPLVKYAAPVFVLGLTTVRCGGDGNVEKSKVSVNPTPTSTQETLAEHNFADDLLPPVLSQKGGATLPPSPSLSPQPTQIEVTPQSEVITPIPTIIRRTPDPTPYIPKPTEPSVIVTAAPTPPPPVITPAPTPEPTRVYEARPDYEWANYILNRINQIRLSQDYKYLNLSPLRRVKELDEAALAYMKVLAEKLPGNLHFVHDLKGTPLSRAEEAGYSAFWIGEDGFVADVLQNTAEDVISAWMNSDTHKAAILSFPNPAPDTRITDFGGACLRAQHQFPDGDVRIMNFCAVEFGIPK